MSTTRAKALSRIPTSIAAATRASLFDTWQPTARTHLLHASIAAFLVIVDVFLSPVPLTPARLGLTTLSACCLPLASRLPIVGATVSLAVTAAALKLPGEVSGFGIAMCWGPLALLASRGHHPGTVWALTTLNLLASTSLGTFAPLRQLTISAVVGAPCLTLGLILRRQRHRDDADARLRQQQRDHLQRLLVSELHDTVVRNLTHAVMQAEQVRLARPHDPDLAHTLDTVTSPVRTAVGQLRYLLKAMSAAGDDTTLLLSSTPPRPLDETLANARQILSQRGTSLTADGLEALDDDTIGPGAHQQITRILNELIDNAVKYAAPHGHVTLLLETDSNTLECMCTNTCTPPTTDRQQAARKAPRRPRRPDHTSSGLGLDAARRRTESLGGTLATSHTPHRWTTTLSIPLRPAPSIPHPSAGQQAPQQHHQPQRA